MKKCIIILILIIGTIFLVGCTNNLEKEQIANPASVYCIDKGGKLEIRTEVGGQYGVCIFENGKECEEWAYYRGECVP